MRKISFLLGLVLLTFVIGMGSCATPKKDSQAKPQPAPSLTHPISMVWQHKDDPSVDLSSLPKVPGLTVVSPCWYRVTGEYGKVEGAAVPGYTERAHKKGYQVWPLVTNSFDPDLTHKFLQDPHAQRFIIDQLLKEAETHGFDGINIDFENIYEKDRDALTSFMAYLRRQSQKKGLILSMDVTAPSRNPNWSRCYDRKALTKSVDYLVLMTYDQFSRLSKCRDRRLLSIGMKRRSKRLLPRAFPRKNFYLVSHFICAYGRPRKAPRSIGREPLVCGRPSSSFMIKRTFRPSGRPGSQRKR